MDSLELSLRLCKKYPGHWFEVSKFHSVGVLHSFQVVWGRAPSLEEMVEYLTSVGGDVYRTTRNLDVQKSLLVNFHVSENAKGDLCEQQQQPQQPQQPQLRGLKEKKKWWRYLLGIKTWLSIGSDMSQ